MMLILQHLLLNINKDEHAVISTFALPEPLIQPAPAQAQRSAAAFAVSVATDRWEDLCSTRLSPADGPV